MNVTPHDAARLHVTGAARYIDDIPTPANTLHLAFGLSTVAHGKIVSINLDEVRKADGVIAVLTAEDLPADNDVSPSVHDEPLLADGTVHYVGRDLASGGAQGREKGQDRIQGTARAADNRRRDAGRQPLRKTRYLVEGRSRSGS
jgi:xanthine dehydrogenase molybdopterin-binding subunit B